jgi:hypothetical protein
MNVHNITVSACRGAFDRFVRPVNLVEWLESVRPDTFAYDSNDKRQLPAIMPHGVFESRKAESFVQHSGLVQIDIDAKDNRGINMTEVLSEMAQLEFMVCAGLSASGKGVWGLAAVEDITRTNHAQKAVAFMDYMEQTFEPIRFDRVVSHSLASIRFASHDSPYINLDVVPFDTLAL